IWAESELGEGSTFYFALPASEEKAAVPALAPRPSKTREVLIVKDDASFAQLLAEHLARAGYESHIAITGEEGLALAQRNNPAAILLDIMLPGKLDGWDVLARLKANPTTKEIPVIICTALEDRTKAITLGASDFLTKPTSPEDLRAAIDRQMKVRPNTILVVDDDADLRQMLAEALTENGYQVRTAANGKEALEAIQGEQPDLMILNLMMPVLDGFAVLEELRLCPETFNLPVIILTGKTLVPEEKAFLNKRMAQLLQKSERSPGQIVEMIAQMLA
ncbi:MAG: response regulator, partial [Chloroflexota bacterium]